MVQAQELRNKIQENKERIDFLKKEKEITYDQYVEGINDVNLDKVNRAYDKEIDKLYKQNERYEKKMYPTPTSKP